MRIKILILIILLINGCTSEVTYSNSNISEWHLIDFGDFSVETPKNYYFRNGKSIDSFAGTIENKKISISFDYGMYSPKGPMNKEDYINKYKNRIHPTALTELISKIDISSYQEEDGSYNPSEILSHIDSIKLIEETNQGNTESFNYTYQISYNGDNYTIPLRLDEKILENESNFFFDRDTISSIERRYFISKDSSDRNNSIGIYLCNLESYDENLNSFTEQLFLSARNFPFENRSEIETIILSARLK